MFIHVIYQYADLWKHDIALILLEKAIPTDDDNISPVSLPLPTNSSWPEDGQVCIVKGWGCTQQGESSLIRCRHASHI